MMIKNDARAPKLGQHPNIPTHPNTDSRELKLRILDFMSGNLHIILEDEGDQSEIPRSKFAKDLAAQLQSYTANKQKELLEWVEQKVIGPDGFPSNQDPMAYQQNFLRAYQRKLLKNKKESL